VREIPDCRELLFAVRLVEAPLRRPIQLREVREQFLLDLRPVGLDDHLASIARVKRTLRETGALEPIDHTRDRARGQTRQLGQPAGLAPTYSNTVPEERDAEPAESMTQLDGTTRRNVNVRDSRDEAIFSTLRALLPLRRSGARRRDGGGLRA